MNETAINSAELRAQAAGLRLHVLMGIWSFLY